MNRTMEGMEGDAIDSNKISILPSRSAHSIPVSNAAIVRDVAQLISR